MLRHLAVRWIVGGLILVLGIISGRPAPAAILTNGSFETGLLPTPPGTTFTAGSTSIEGWVVGGHGIDYIGTYWHASDGDRSVDLDSGTILGDGPYDGSISQTFASIVGQMYVVSFDLAGNPDGGPGERSVRISAAGQSSDFTFVVTDQTSANMGYLGQAFLFIATAPTTTLSFTSLSGTGYGPVIDNVVVNIVPEASTFALAAAGAVAMLMLRPRKKPLA